MTSPAASVGADPHRLLADARDLAHRVRVARRVTWLPLLVLALVTFGAIPVYRYGPQVLSDCRPIDGTQTCKVFFQGAVFYWWVTLALAYVVIAAGYLRVARNRGLGARVLPYVLTGAALEVLSATATAVLVAIDSPWFPGEPSFAVLALLRLLDPTSIVGLALLVLAWLERRVAVAGFAVGYLAVVLLRVDLGWGDHWDDRWGFTPHLVISGGLLLLGSAGFAVADHLRRPR